MISGWFISIVTFPGTILHEWAHKKFCEWFGVRVLAVKYFSVEADGWVVHERPTTYQATFWISVGPLIINSLACFIVGLIVGGFLNNYNGSEVAFLFTAWLALSFGAHSFPSDQDMKNVLQESKIQLKNGSSSLHYLAYPLFGLMWLANILRFFWFDFIWALLIMFFAFSIVGAI